jgi:MinD superfamily P-loop ATPase
VKTVGADFEALAPADFALPAADITANMPGWLAQRLRGLATARPCLARPAECTRCGKCAENCPVDAITLTPVGPAFDDSTCIRCYCCQELCPTQAIDLTTPPLARLASRRRGRYERDRGA